MVFYARSVGDSVVMTEASGEKSPDTHPKRLWDVALSFAGAQRDYVGRVAAALKARGVRCFYDADEQVKLWGTHLAEELPRIYALESAVVVVFISADYADRDYTRLERRAAFSQAVSDAGVYVLPARFDDSKLPGLLTDVVGVNLRGYTPELFADMVVAKLADLGISPSAPSGPPAVPRRLGINVLGDLEFVPGAPELAALKGPALEVLILLVTAWPEDSTAEGLSWQLRLDRRLDQSAVVKCLRELQEAGIPVRQRRTRPERYSLDPDCVTVDAWSLLEGVASDPGPEEIGRLARLWRSDPERAHMAGSWQWRQIQRARDDLVRLIERLDPSDRPGAATLKRIAPELAAGADVAAARRATRPRILVIDDLHAQTVAQQAIAGSDYKCDLIESFSEWEDFKERVDVGAEYCAALVDLHLNGDPAVDDKLGLGIISWLRDHTDIPVAAVSSAPGTGSGEGRDRLRAEYRLVEIVDKGQRNQYLNEIPKVVRLLVSNADICRRKRLETWLMHAERRWRRHAFDQRFPAEEMARAQKEYEAADVAVRHKSVDEATALVEAFCERWTPAGDDL